jgi:glycosyltransferase involved in cell wall biosynthesis
MRIGLDLRMLGGGSGIDRYITELSKQILNLDKTNQYVLFFHDAENANKYTHFGHKCVVTGIRHYSFAEQLKFPQILNRENLDVMHFPHFNVPIMYRKAFVVTIHDLTHTLFPGRKLSHIIHRIAYRMVFRSAINNSKKIIAVSEATKKSIMEYFGIKSEKITVVYEGYNEVFAMTDKWEAFQKVSAKFGITKKYLLYVGAWRRYKNLSMLARAFDQLIAKGADLELVLAGEPDPFYPEIESSIRGIKSIDRVKILGRVTDEDLKQLYNATTLFVLPSLTEGFGLIALEAAASGVPVVCSDIPVLREIMGQGAEYFDPQNLDNMTDVLGNLLNDPKRLEELANLALSRSRHFSWKQAGQQTLEVYKTL